MNASPIRERFEGKYIPEPNSGCFLWTGAIDPAGYGRINYEGRNWKASRIAWLLTFGDPGELFVLHKCDNRICVNPDHLFLGTSRDNFVDMCRKCRHPAARLSLDQIRTIRGFRRKGLGWRKIARATGIKADLVQGVVRGTTYVHVS